MKLHNTLTRKTEDIHPLSDKEIKLYTCGLTVYNQPHIGNWVGYIYWDVLVKALETAGFKVTRTQNITDVGHLVSDDDSGEDKMEKGAKREGVTAWDVAKKYIGIADHEAYELLGLKRPDYLVRATDYIPQQIAFVEELEKKGYTYEIPDEGIYFDTGKLKDYGKLARLDIEGLKAGERVSVEGKRNITDFALWKFSPKDAQRDMEWDSPWGKGFPGWHLECSVIARETLGDQIDIHTGGIDHIPVHHTNEIAQTEAVTGKPFATYWVHNNHLKVDGGKMAKSLGNIYTLQDVVDRGYSIEAYKLLVLSKHYRTEGNFTWEILEAAQNRLQGYQDWADLKHQKAAQTEGQLNAIYKQGLLDIFNALQDDLDTPTALAKLSELAGSADEHGVDKYKIQPLLNVIDNLLGLKLANRPDITHEQKDLIADREAARVAKDWKKSDEIRARLEKQGIGVRDTDGGPIWFRIKA
jgi:cysteinyl-tRNA synthetase